MACVHVRSYVQLSFAVKTTRVVKCVYTWRMNSCVPVVVQECVQSRSVYYPGVCAIQECVLSRSVYYPGMCAIQECVLSRSVYYPGVCTYILIQVRTYVASPQYVV